MTSVIVTPLQPPFTQDVMFFDFGGDTDKTLAVSKSDGEKIRAMLSNEPVGRQVVLGPIDDERIEVSVLQ